MATRADLWLRKNRAGKPLHWKWKTVNLRTLDAHEARARARLAKAGKWPPPEEAAAKVSVQSFALQPDTVGVSSPGGASAHLQAETKAESVAADSEEHQPTAPLPSTGGTDWTNVAAAAAADAGAEPLKPEVVNPRAEQEEREATNGDLASMVVGVQLWTTEQLIKRKVWDQFVAPSVGDVERAGLAAPYKAMLDYGGAKIKMPPWVTGLVFPAAIALMSAAAMSRAWAELARAQKAQADATAPQQAAA